MSKRSLEGAVSKLLRLYPLKTNQASEGLRAESSTSANVTAQPPGGNGLESSDRPASPTSTDAGASPGPDPVESTDKGKGRGRGSRTSRKLCNMRSSTSDQVILVEGFALEGSLATSRYKSAIPAR